MRADLFSFCLAAVFLLGAGGVYAQPKTPTTTKTATLAKPLVPAKLPAQTKQRIRFDQSGKVAIVSGVIKSGQTVEYLVNFKKDTDLEIYLDTPNDSSPAPAYFPRFVVLRPNGKPLYADDNEPTIDLMDVFETAGDYTIRLKLEPDAEKKLKNDIKFTLRIVIR